MMRPIQQPIVEKGSISRTYIQVTSNDELQKNKQ